MVHGFWRAFDLPMRRGAAARAVHAVIAVVALALLVWCAANVVRWQTSVRSTVGMEEVTQGHLPLSLGIASVVFGSVLLLARLVRSLARRTAQTLGHVLSPRAANLLGLVVAALLLCVVTEHGVVRVLFGLADEASRPDAAGIAAFTGREALQLLRIHVGREQADTAEGRTAAALAEMDRVRAWDRALLVLAIPTGTGWLDPGSHDVMSSSTAATWPPWPCSTPTSPRPTSTSGDGSRSVSPTAGTRRRSTGSWSAADRRSTRAAWREGGE
ncbi:alpha/beta-hydrolase N-terminal domain-containing protein [Rubellimicrobium aerolatum]|uniref:Alpha/beta-hydrolase N-terminal domain-containing protein n=1 Tax=Rubellimicrobium aerolatum TaxID=490979 RepID=A0ABW0SAF1_9RHOB|nr:alpha/beta-hydrolase N-terminal domain-containing protein [Rubellimicrobium aerolatum]MBP1805238.1 putative membrane protein [Rubellimicrobium aerolatum]